MYGQPTILAPGPHRPPIRLSPARRFVYELALVPKLSIGSVVIIDQWRRIGEPKCT